MRSAHRVQDWPGRDSPPQSAFSAWCPFRLDARSAWASRGPNGGRRLGPHRLLLMPRPPARSDRVRLSRSWRLGLPASSWRRSSRYSCLFQHSRGSTMKTHLITHGQQGADGQQRVADRLRRALRPLQWLLARFNTLLEGLDGPKFTGSSRRSVVNTVRSSDSFGAPASHASWPARQPRALALIPVRITTAQPNPRELRRDRYE